MHNDIISNLDNFTKPDKEFIQDKECLICLESIDIETNKIVKLPCQCKYSVYHIICIIKLLHSGQNKNFCPHCKTIYICPINPINPINLVLPSNQVHPFRGRNLEELDLPIHTNPLHYYEYMVINRDIQQINEIYTSQLISFSQIMLFHVVVNTLMNIINISVSSNHVEYYQNPTFQVLALFYFCKIVFNIFFVIYSKNNIDKIETCLIYSYTYQIVILGLLIYLLVKIKYNYNCTMLIINNILFSFIDLIFRLIVEYKLNNRINILE
jgi:hypothetical protein